MTIYKRAIHFKNGETLTITDTELSSVQKAILEGNRWIRVQGELISADTIARIGNHHATAAISLREKTNEERALIMNGQGDVVDERRKLLAQRAIINCTTNTEKGKEITEECCTDMNDVLSWKDSNGELHYS